MNTADYLRCWLSDRSMDLRPRTIECYSTQLDLHIAPGIGHIPITSLDASSIKTLLSAISNRGMSRTAELCYVILHAALSDAPGDPMRGVRRPQHHQHSPIPWSDEDMRRYCSALPDHPHGLPLGLCIYLGLRRGEACGLRWCDVDLKAGIAHICNQRLRLSTGAIVDAPLKSSSSIRDLPICAPLLAQLRAHRSQSIYVDDITPSGLNQAHRSLTKRLGLRHIALHGLRHSMATCSLRHGGDMRNIQSILGHSSYTTTANIYTHPDLSMLKASIDAVANFCYTETGVSAPDF